MNEAERIYGAGSSRMSQREADRAEIEALRKKIEQMRLDIHSCGPTCMKAACLNRRLMDEVEALRKNAERYATLWRLQDDGDLYLCEVKILNNLGNTKQIQFDLKAELDAYLDMRAARPQGEKHEQRTTR